MLLTGLIEEIIEKLPAFLREEALEKGFMIRAGDYEGELQFTIEVPNASEELKKHLRNILNTYK